MRILLKTDIGCDPAAAWEALHSPHALSELYGPLVRLESALPLPARWEHGDDAVVRMTLGGLLPLGSQLIDISDRTADDAHGPVRIMRDSGIPLSGPLSSLTVWDHQLAVSASPRGAGRTLWRERLVFDGPAALPLWPVLWGVWQARAARLRALAPGWAHEPGDDGLT